MIHSFTCKNFYSFADETTINFVVNNNAPKNNGYFKTKSGKRLSKVVTVIGPNASGKTNLLKVLPLFKWLVVDSFNSDPISGKIPVAPFLFTKKVSQEVELEAVFEIGGKVYTYAFVLMRERILSESLKLTEFAKQKKSSKTLFRRVWDKKHKRYELSKNSFGLLKEFKNFLRPNASVIDTATRLNHKESRSIKKFWHQVYTNVAEGWADDSRFDTSRQLVDALNFYIKNSALQEEAKRILSRLDLGLSEFHIEKVDGMIRAQTTHSVVGEEYPFYLNYESSGTKQLLIILQRVLSALDTGGVAVVDELDDSLHPEIVLALIQLFVQPETNPKNAQLFFSTHSHLALSYLDKYQIVLVEKAESGISDAWHLDDMEGVPTHDNYFNKYLTGAYGAVPSVVV